MAHSPYRCHGYFPQRQAKLLPWVTKCRLQLIPSENGSYPATRAKASSLLTEKHQAVKDVAALLKRIRIHPEAQRILGNSDIPVVSLERLNFRALFLSSSLQPVVSLVRLPCPLPSKLCCDTSRSDRQNGFSQETSSKPNESSVPDPVTTSWTEPCCPDGSTSEEPEQDSSFDCDFSPDQPYILLDSESDEWDPDGRTDLETIYLDPDPVVIQLDPELEADQDAEDETGVKCHVDIVQEDDSEDHRLEGVDSFICQYEPGPGAEEVDGLSSVPLDGPEPGEVDGPGSMEVDGPDSVELAGPQPEEVDAVEVDGPEPEEMESDDFCAVCENGGDLLCCDRCPKVYHLACHVPPLTSFPLGDWACTLCRTDQEPVNTYDCEKVHSWGSVRAAYTLSHQDQRRCEKLTLLLYCHAMSAPFHEPVSPLARNYYQIIKRPINLSVIRRKLDKSNTLHYFTVEQFIDDVLLMFRNCATFNYPDSEVAKAGRNLELFFLNQLKEVFPDQTFPSASQDTIDRARLRWLSRKTKEIYTKRRYPLRGQKCVL